MITCQMFSKWPTSFLASYFMNITSSSVQMQHNSWSSKVLRWTGVYVIHLFFYPCSPAKRLMHVPFVEVWGMLPIFALSPQISRDQRIIQTPREISRKNLSKALKTGMDVPSSKLGGANFATITIQYEDVVSVFAEGRMSVLHVHRTILRHCAVGLINCRPLVITSDFKIKPSWLSKT